MKIILGGVCTVLTARKKKKKKTAWRHTKTASTRCQFIKKHRQWRFAQLWQHNPRQLHYSNNLSQKKKISKDICTNVYLVVTTQRRQNCSSNSIVLLSADQPIAPPKVWVLKRFVAPIRKKGGKYRRSHPHVHTHEAKYFNRTQCHPFPSLPPFKQEHKCKSDKKNHKKKTHISFPHQSLMFVGNLSRLIKIAPRPHLTCLTRCNSSLQISIQKTYTS